MTSSNETLKHIIRDYNPKKQEMLCRIDLIKLSQMEVLKNPTPDKKDVYETFFEYASALVKNHPTAYLDEYIEKVLGSSVEKMAEIAPDAAEKYKALVHPEPMKQNHVMEIAKEQNVVGA